MTSSSPMSGTASSAISAGPVVDTRRSPWARHRPLLLGDVRLRGGFWAGRLAMLRQVTLRRQFAECEADRPARDVWGIMLQPDAVFAAEEAPDLLGGVTVLRGPGIRPPGPPSIERFPLVAVPYYAWANREPGPMAVWIREAPA
jgi:hypothetical protein